MHGDRLADDQAIADEFADGLTGVGVGDLGDLIGVKPNLALATANHGGGEALLGAKVDPVTADIISIRSKMGGNQKQIQSPKNVAFGTPQNNT